MALIHFCKPSIYQTPPPCLLHARPLGYGQSPCLMGFNVIQGSTVFLREIKHMPSLAGVGSDQ